VFSCWLDGSNFFLSSILYLFQLSAALAANVHDRAYYESKFFGWMAEHKIQATSGEHFVRMIQNFANNDDLIEQHNAKKATYTLGHNQFSHMDSAEWSAYVKGTGKPTKVNAEFTHHAPTEYVAASEGVDWVAKGAVNAVKDQGQCGSCWAFSTVGALEGAYKIKGNALDVFSEQWLVSCDNRKNGGSDLGCNGGLMDSAFEFLSKNGGLPASETVPYTSGTTKQNGDCNMNVAKVAGTTPKSWTDVTPNSDAAMMSALDKQPVAVAIEADEKAFQLYKSGVFTAACGDNLDHGVVAVGYGTDKASGLDFYNVRNSWGSSWGEGGYIRFQRGVSQKSGQCGILSQPSYVNL
jgi:C1A family cysteine protease